MVFTYIYHKNQPYVRKYTGPMDPMGLCNSVSSWIFCCNSKFVGVAKGFPRRQAKRAKEMSHKKGPEDMSKASFDVEVEVCLQKADLDVHMFFNDLYMTM